ncbi:MAG TPA: TauD/TfdA family dioxygenase [Stellaceae bacterium]|nr:TauD/TfdA family dioxygenase [Stellaceae bacterium]
MRFAPTQAPPGLELVRDDGTRIAIHPLWLRERCRDAALLDARTEQRLYNPSDLDPALQITDIAGSAESGWRIAFSDGTRDVFAERDLLAELDPARDPVSLPARITWSATLSPLPRAAWTDTAEPEATRRVLEDFLAYGFVILTGVPRREGMVLEVGRRFGFPRETNFGALFDVRSVPQANDLAYTGLALDPHTDNPYRDPVPGVQLLHCLVNESKGGLSTLVDGLAVAEALRAEDPAAFELLATVPVRFRYVDIDTELVDAAPIIEHNGDGTIAGIRYSPRLDFPPLMAPERLDAFYRARRKLDEMLRSAAFEVRFLLADGDLAMFDNRRLLHGRTGFDPRDGHRHLQGCYIDIDGPRSLYRVLRRAG